MTITIKSFTKVLTTAVMYALLCTSISSTHAQTEPPSNSDIQTILAVDSLAYLSQSLVKSYFYVNNGLNVSMAKLHIKNDVEKLRENLVTIRQSSDQAANPAELHSTIDQMQLVVDDFDESLQQPFNTDNALLVVDMGEVILEATHNIKLALPSPKDPQAATIDLLHALSFFLERLTKLYIVIHSGFDDEHLTSQIPIAVQSFDTVLPQVRALNDSTEFQQALNKLQQRWDKTKELYLKQDQTQMPQTVFYSTTLMARQINKLLKMAGE